MGSAVGENCPSAHRPRLRTSNLLERVNKEVKRRTRVTTPFPDEAALLRLASAILMETGVEGKTGKEHPLMDSRASSPS